MKILAPRPGLYRRWRGFASLALCFAHLAPCALSSVPQNTPEPTPAGELVLECISREVQQAAQKATGVLAHVEVRIDLEVNWVSSGVLVDAAQRLLAVPYHPKIGALDRAYVRLLGADVACLGYFVGSNPDRSASFVRLQFGADTKVQLKLLEDAPAAAVNCGAAVIVTAPSSSLNAKGQPEMAVWSTMIRAAGQSYRGRMGLLQLQTPLGWEAHGAVIADPRGRIVGFVPDLQTALEEPSSDAKDKGKHAPAAPNADAEQKANLSAREFAAHGMPIERLRSEALEALRAFRLGHVEEPPWPTQPWLGVYLWRPEFEKDGENMGFEPFQILAVFEGSPAQRSGLVVGDVLKAINGVPLAASMDFMRGLELMSSQPPHVLRMSVRRDQDVLQLEAVLNPEIKRETTTPRKGSK